MLKDLVAKCRSYRRFYGDIQIPMEELRELVDTARLTASTGNSQPLKFKIVSAPSDCAAVYANLTWAAALKDWDGPPEAERPTAYILILCDQRIAKNRLTDTGIAAQTIMLAATEKGYGGCMIGNCRRGAILNALGLDPDTFSLDLVLALGKPKEEVLLVSVGDNGSTAYYRDENQVHYVPKRSLEDILL